MAPVIACMMETGGWRYGDTISQCRAAGSEQRTAGPQAGFRNTQIEIAVTIGDPPCQHCSDVFRIVRQSQILLGHRFKIADIDSQSVFQPVRHGCCGLVGRWRETTDFDAHSRIVEHFHFQPFLNNRMVTIPRSLILARARNRPKCRNRQRCRFSFRVAFALDFPDLPTGYFPASGSSGGVVLRDSSQESLGCLCSVLGTDC